MKRCMVSILLILLFALPLSAKDIPSGSSAFGVKFPGWKLNPYGAINCVALKFYDADVSVEFFYDGEQVDSVLQVRGDGVTYTTPCDSINIIRSTATGGIYLIGSRTGKICPEIANSGHAVSPELRTAPDITLIVQGLDKTSQGAYPVNGINITGARAAGVYVDWLNFDAGIIVVELIVGTTGNAGVDTLTKFITAGNDTTMTYNLTTAETYEHGAAYIPLHGFDGGVLDGFLYVRITDGAGLALPADIDIDVGIKVVW